MYEVRETAGFSGNTNIIYAPALGFHWGGVVASSILMEASGRISIRNNPGTGYEAFVASIVYGDSDMRSPIFYDSANTAYYLDPNSGTSGYLAGVLRQNDGRYVRDSYYRTISGYSDYYTSGTSGWYTVASITLTGNCTGAVLFGTLNDNRYDGADAYQISVVARAECDFTSNNESHYVNVGCTILGSTNFTDYRSKIRVLLVASSTNSRTYQLQFFETAWNNDTWELQTTGWTLYSSPQAPGSSTGTPRVNYISKQNADYTYTNIAAYSPIFYDSANTGYYLDPNSTTSLRTVGSWRSDSSSWDGEFSGKIQYHSNHWYIQGADLLIFRNSGGSNVFYVNQSGVAIATGEMRAPIFYDQDNTGYYLNPASTSNLYRIDMAERIRLGAFPNSTTNTGEAWIGRANDRNTGTMTVQLGGNSASGRSFEVVDYAWSVVLASVSSGGTFTASGDVVAYSDIRIKENIKPLENALNKTLLLSGVSYNRTDLEDKSRKIGFIAQDVMKILPEAVTYNNEQDRYAVSYGNITALLVEAIKEQQKQIDELKTKLK
jgi:hypothetical protein